MSNFSQKLGQVAPASSEALRQHSEARSFFRSVIWLLLFLLVSRLVAMYCVPLNDSTEARYGEIARLMLQTGNWITPMHYLGVPFWAKPPLSTWLSAGAMQVFGVNELAVRLPGLLLSIAILGLVWNVAKRRSGSSVAMIAVVVLASSLYFLLDAGTVMTDPSLLFCTTLSLIAFWHAMVFQSRVWRYVFFIGLGLGLLAKGPVAVVLCGMPIFCWILWQRKWMEAWQRLPWIKGGLLMFAIALPWYWLAEHKTPGFINYFIVGEHLARFLQPGWTGDKYGFAHSAPYGMIWVYALMGVFPWTFVSLYWLIRHRKKLPVLCRDQDGWVAYLLLCTLVPLIFFTFARNIIYPYVFPSLPTFALLFAELAHRARLSLDTKPWFLKSAAINGVIFIVMSLVFIYKPELIAKSQDRVVNACRQHHLSNDSALVYWAPKLDYSSLFYSAGKAKATLDQQELCRWLSSNATNYVVLDSRESTPLPSHFFTQLDRVSIIKVLKKQYTVYQAAKVKC